MSQILFTNAGALRMTTTKTWDYVNRLLSISSANASGAVLDSHAYSYNSANQRTSMTNADGTYWIYQYDPLGQVTSGRKYWPDGYPVAGQQFGYAFDNIENRTSTQAGGDQWGANLLSANYSANNLNQYTSRTVPGAVDVLGSATNLATVTVNNYPTIRKQSYYRAEIPVANSSGPVYQAVTNLAVLNRGTNADLIGTNIGNLLIPPATQTFNYDQDGNTTNDSLWSYVWDGENRLIQMTSDSTVPTAAQKQLNFAYDDQGRRIQKIVTVGGVAQSTNIFIYDGWNLICELDGASGAVIRNYMWGLDLSGSMRGAGGVGGLLSVSSSGTNGFVAYDGNGNVSELLNAASGSALAQYEYCPFGEVIRAIGPMATSHPVRCSTKYEDIESALLYYGHRFLNSETGRWISRDPSEEHAGLSLYALVRNSPVNAVDYLGMLEVKYIGRGFQYVKGPPEIFWLGLQARLSADEPAKLGSQGALLTHIVIDASVTPCCGTTREVSEEMYFADLFEIYSSLGSIAGGPNIATMDDGQNSITFQPANYSSQILLGYPGVGYSDYGPPVPSQGHFVIRWQYELQPFDDSADYMHGGFNSPGSSGYSRLFWPEADHKPWRADQPMSWSYLSFSSMEYVFYFSWDNCAGGSPVYAAAPRVQSGPQRPGRGEYPGSQIFQ